MSKTLLLAIALTCSSAAVAQPLGNTSLNRFDSKAPIDVDADRIEVLDAEKQATFTGNVHVRQGDLSIEAARIRVNYEHGANNSDPVIQRLDADGNVRLTSPTERATARFGIYDVPQRILTLIGDVKLNQGGNNISGNRLTIDLESGRSSMDGRTSTGAAAGSRVSGRFAVPERAGSSKK